MMRQRENKNSPSVSSLPNTSHKIPKKFKKFQNTIMASFQAKIGWKWLRKKENKNYISVTFLLDWLEKIAKNFKIRLWHHFKPK